MSCLLLSLFGLTVPLSNLDIDHEVRWCILKLADLLIRPVEETPPSVKIHIPSTPVIETSSVLSAVKAQPAKPLRSIKPGGPPPKKPSLTLNPTARVRLSAGPLSARSPARVLPALATEAVKKVVNFATPSVPSKAKSQKAAKPLTGKAGTKPAHVPKSQSSGMSLNDLRASRNALKKLQSNKHARIFLQPVDPIRDHAPKSVIAFIHF